MGQAERKFEVVEGRSLGWPVRQGRRQRRDRGRSASTKAGRAIITLKDGRQEHDLVALAKALIGPDGLANGGQMTAQAASRLISMVFKDDFLSKVTAETMSRLAMSSI